MFTIEGDFGSTASCDNIECTRVAAKDTSLDEGPSTAQPNLTRDQMLEDRAQAAVAIYLRPKLSSTRYEGNAARRFVEQRLVRETAHTAKMYSLSQHPTSRMSRATNLDGGNGGRGGRGGKKRGVGESWSRRAEVTSTLCVTARLST
ncbi:hypothetical protein POSPLADRAFT_1045861 [Postia placenta MAD-698-R-SB12]|uniref:Uncharacterized protein n=1 Tax=Postia placenta MAD-698-R-SB12 TaxID=670580 RepID=A0A1X6N4K9_9APHY|nr:hypothetical protein POSPLADRAFT_1045861 [Postia placenta MAD-698-R-SB12]OSX63547.1 hypothetical protein POSPLADRAFT_1045861 [Postia placenta MAD-698-R-SB12]